MASGDRPSARASGCYTSDNNDEDGRMKDSPFRDRLVDVMEELYEITILLRDHIDYLGDRHSERKEAAAKLVAETVAKAIA